MSTAPFAVSVAAPLLITADLFMILPDSAVISTPPVVAVITLSAALLMSPVAVVSLTAVPVRLAAFVTPVLPLSVTAPFSEATSALFVTLPAADISVTPVLPLSAPLFSTPFLPSSVMLPAVDLISPLFASSPPALSNTSRLTVTSIALVKSPSSFCSDNAPVTSTDPLSAMALSVVVSLAMSSKLCTVTASALLPSAKVTVQVLLPPLPNATVPPVVFCTVRFSNSL